MTERVRPPQQHTPSLSPRKWQVHPITERERERWDDFVSAHPQGHLLQSYAWGELKGRFGWTPLRLALLRDGQIEAGAQVLFRQLPLVTMAYVPRGPLVDWADSVAVRALFQALHATGRSRRALVLKIEPNFPDHPTFPQQMATLGFRPAATVQPRSSMVVDLKASEKDILDQFKSKTRYNIRLASRRGVTLRAAQGPEDVDRFYDMLRETAQRDEFGIHTREYYQAVYHLLNQAGQGVLLFAEREGQTLAALWAAACGPESIYMYGASRREGQRHMPTYLLQWEAIRWAQTRGCHRYDLWGIPDSIARGEDERENLPEKNVRDGLWGVYRFKQGFGGELVRTVGAYDLPYWPWLYRIYRHLLRQRP